MDRDKSFALVVVLTFLLGLGLWLLLSSVRRTLKAHRLRQVAVVPAAAGAITLVVLLAGFGLRFVPLLHDALQMPFLRGDAIPESLHDVVGWLLMFAVLLVGIAFGEAAVASLPRAVAGLLGRATATVEDVTRALVAGVLVVGASGISFLIDRQLQSAEITALAGATHLFDVQLPGSPTDAEVIGDGQVLVTTAEGDIVLVSIGPDAASSSAQVVATGLSFPQGLGVLNDVVYVSDQGELPCLDPLPYCVESTIEGELAMIRTTEGRVVAFDLSDGGLLTNKRVVFDGLPVVSTEHALHDIDLGPDGRLYMSIGGVDRIGLDPQRIDEIDQSKSKYLGTIVSFGPEGADLEIHARGLRNVYGLTFGDGGELLGTDNDGEAGRGRKLEELLDLAPGSDFGFPGLGTFSEQRDKPITVLQSDGTSAIEWAPAAGLESGVLVGDIDSVDYIPLKRDADGFYSPEFLQVRLIETDGFVTTLETLSDERLLVGVFRGFASEAHALRVVRVVVASEP